MTAGHPLIDLFVSLRHPFPADMEEMLWAIHRVDRSALRHVEGDVFDWAAGERLDEGREKLRALMRTLGAE